MDCVCLRIVVCNTYCVLVLFFFVLVYPMLPASLGCVVFLFCFSSSCVPYVASFSGFSILIVPTVFSNFFLYYHEYEFKPYFAYRNVSIAWIEL